MLAITAIACSDPQSPEVNEPGTGQLAVPEVAAHASKPELAANIATEQPTAAERPPQCADPVLLFEAGAHTETLCPEQAVQRGLTIVDLSDDMAPLVMSESPREGGQQPYLPIYRALANEQLGAGKTWARAREDRYFELFGIPPTLSVLRRRLDDDERHRCHDRITGTLPGQPAAAIGAAALAALSQTIREEPASAGWKRKRQAQRLERELERQRKKSNLETLDELAEKNRYYSRVLSRARRARTAIQAISAAQEILVCDKLLQLRDQDRGIFGWRTSAAVGAFQRQHMLMADESLGQHTREALLAASRDRDFRAALRALRERVVAATGLIEDGSAQEQWSTVLGHPLDSSAFRTPTGHDLPDHGAPDLIARFTERAAQELGWTSFEATRGFLAEHVPGRPSSATGQAEPEPLALRVAVKLPPLPAYHSEHMELRAVIDRGDVNYDFPNWKSRGCQAHRVESLPTLTLYARDGDREIALARWHTTIGGWNRERMPSGWIAMRYKNSDVGKRVWRDIVAAPSWHPPKSTPDDDLVRRTQRGWQVKYDTLGPSYRSAYGLVMLIHHQVVERKSGTVFWDRGIRTHGSANYLSIRRGCSHGCHRLFNHQALRLASFLLRHRSHIRHGRLEAWYKRKIKVGNRFEQVSLRSRGYRYELTPPVEVEVTRGRITSRQRVPFRGARPVRRARPAPSAAEPAGQGNEASQRPAQPDPE